MTESVERPFPAPLSPPSAERKAGTGFRRLADSLPEPVWAAQADALCDFVNRAWCRRTGQSPEDALALGWLQAVPPDERARTLDLWREGAATGQPFDLTLRLRPSDRSFPHVCQVRVEPLNDAASLWFAVARPGHPAELAPDLAPDRPLRTALETLLDCVGIFTALREPASSQSRGPVVDFRIDYLNAAAVASAGQSAANLLGRPLSEVAPAQAASGLLDQYCRVVETGEPFGRDTLCYDGARGRRWYDLRVTRLGDGFVASWRDVTERKRADDALRANASRFRQFADNLHDAIWMADPRRGRVLFLSQAHERIWGTPRQQAYDQPDSRLDAVHPDDRARVRQAYVAAYEYPFQEEYRVVRPDGSTVWVRDRGFAIRDETGRPLHLAGLVEDITERKEAEEACRASEAHFRGIFESSVVPLWLWHADGRVLDANEAYLSLLGLDRADLASGRVRWDQMTPPEHLDRDARALEQLRTQGRCEPFEKEYLRANGTRVPVLVGRSMLPDRTDQGVAFAIDLSAQRQAQEALRASEERFRALADNVAQLAWMAGRDGELFWYNRRWYDYTGTTPDQMMGSGWRLVHHPDHLARVEAKYRRAIAAGEAWEDTFPLRGHDGVYRWFLSRAIPIRDEQGQVTLWFGTNTDVTAQRQVEQALKEADRRKDDFLAMLAHELRNPLGPIRNSVEVLRLSGPPDPSVVQARDMIDRQVQHMARLVDDLLDASRIARGKIKLRKESCDLAAIVRQTCEDYRGQLEAGALTLRVQTPPAPVRLLGDPTRLAQVVSNVLHNAGKFTPAGGRVGVVLETAGGWATLAVRDTGQGMDPAMLRRVFEPFSQADRSLDRERGGLGLGLALVKGLVMLHGGTVSAASAGLGQGTEIALRLPLMTAVGEEPPAAPAPPPLPPRAHRVLIVEDHPDAARSLRTLMRLGGHLVEIAFTGRAGVDAARAFRPDVVLCDIGLPGGLDGYGVARALRADPELGRAFLIAVTGYGQEEDQRRALEAGFDVHLVKPVDYPVLQRLLAELPGRQG